MNFALFTPFFVALVPVEIKENTNLSFMTWYNAMYEIKYVLLHRSQKENNIQVTDDAYKQVKHPGGAFLL